MRPVYFLLVCFTYFSAIATAGIAFDPKKGFGIIGGKSVPIEDHPYQVALEAKGFYCSGAIVSESYVVTTAICALSIPLKNLIKIRSGTGALGTNGTLHSVDSILPHKSFNPAKLENNVALIRVKEPFQFDQSRQPVRLFQSSEELDNGIRGSVTGWGMDKHFKFAKELQEVSVPVVDKSTCKIVYKAVGLDVPENIICAGYVIPGKGSPCVGDWGAPFVVEGRLAGLVSFTAACGLVVLPAWYTEISHYSDWIESVIR